MAINPETQYPGKIAPSSADYPYGEARNITTPGDGKGTPWEKALVNDLFGWQQALLGSSGVVPSGTPDKVGGSQYLEALIKLSGKIFSNVADMVADTNLSIGDIVRTLGYYANGDGGANVYEVVAAATGTADGGTFIDLATHQAKGLFLNNTAFLEQFGVKADGTTDNATAINAFQDSSLLECIWPEGVVGIASTITLKNLKTWRGRGIRATELKLLDNSDVVMLKTDSFDTLTLTNKWDISDGVVHDFSIFDMSLNGNRTNNLTSGGMALYAKRYFIDRVVIFEVAGNGFYSETGDIGGQVDPVNDMPECKIGYLALRGCDDTGFIYRGPHDGYIDTLLSSKCGDRCVSIEKLNGVYSGNPDINFVHAYGANEAFYANSAMRAQHLICESASTHAFKSEDAEGVQVSLLRAFQADTALAGNAAVVIAGSRGIFGNVRISDSNGGGGLVISGQYNKMDVSIDGDGSDAIGLSLISNFCDISGRIDGFTGAGGVALDTALNNNNRLRLELTNSETGWNDVSGFRNRHEIMSILEAGQTPYVGSGPADLTSKYDFFGFDSVNNLYSSKRVLSGTVNIETSGTKTLNIPHGLMAIPDKDSVQLTLGEMNNAGPWLFNWMYVDSVDATNVVVKINITTGTGVALDTARLNMSASVNAQ